MIITLICSVYWNLVYLDYDCLGWIVPECTGTKQLSVTVLQPKLNQASLWSCSGLDWVTVTPNCTRAVIFTFETLLECWIKWIVLKLVCWLLHFHYYKTRACYKNCHLSETCLWQNERTAIIDVTLYFICIITKSYHKKKFTITGWVAQDSNL